VAHRETNGGDGGSGTPLGNHISSERKMTVCLENQFLAEEREMVTAVGPETKNTKTVKRSYLLQWQVRNLLSRTTDISQDYLEKIGGTGIANRWLRAIYVHGFDASNRCHVGLELEINWLTHTIEVVVWGEEVTVNKTVFTDDCAPEVSNAIAVFNQAVNAECLRTAWRVSYAPGVDVARVRRELGLQDAPLITWAGNVSKQSFGVSELPEVKVHLLIAESDELVPKNSRKAAEGGLRDKDLFDRIKEAFG
jgi:hypothetical protein